MWKGPWSARSSNPCQLPFLSLFLGSNIVEIKPALLDFWWAAQKTELWKGLSVRSVGVRSQMKKGSQTPSETPSKNSSRGREEMGGERRRKRLRVSLLHLKLILTVGFLCCALILMETSGCTVWGNGWPNYKEVASEQCPGIVLLPLFQFWQKVGTAVTPFLDSS